MRFSTLPAALVAATFTVGALFTALTLADEPFFTGVGFLPGGHSFSRASAVSGDGSVVVGKAGSWGWQGFEAFRWTRDDGMVGLGVLPDRRSSGAYGASADGAVIVGDSYPPTEAFRWTAQDGMIGLGDLPGGEFLSAAVGVSADGSVVAGSSSSEHSQNSEAFRWTAEDGMVGLGDLPGGNFYSVGYGVSGDGRVIVGVSQGYHPGNEAFRWTVEEGMVSLGDLPGGIVSSVAHDVSADGSVIVGQGRTDEGWEAFRWTADDGMVGLGYLPDALYLYSEAFAASADGSVVAGQAYGEQHRTAFIWDAEHGMRELKEVLTGEFGLDLEGWWLENALGLSADGLTIVGRGYNPDGYTEGWVAHIPEPATGCLVVCALLAMHPRRRR